MYLTYFGKSFRTTSALVPGVRFPRVGPMSMPKTIAAPIHPMAEKMWSQVRTEISSTATQA